MNTRVMQDGVGIIPRRVRRSGAWRAVSDNARQVLIALARRHDGRNNGLLLFDGHDGSVIGLSTRDTELALFELEQVGLIESQPARMTQ